MSKLKKYVIKATNRRIKKIKVFMVKMKKRAVKIVEIFAVSVILSAIVGLLTWNWGYFLAMLITLLLLKQMTYEVDTTWSKSDKYE